MAFEYFVISTEKLFSKAGYKDPKLELLSKNFWGQLQAYEKEIGGSDMGPGAFLIGNPNIFMIRDGGKLIGWIIGAQPFAKVHSEERGFVPTAVYTAPEERGKINMKVSFEKLIETLKSEGFHTLSLQPEFSGLLTKKGERIVTTFNRWGQKRGLKENEGALSGKLVLDKKTVVSFIEGEIVRRGAAQVPGRKQEPSGLVRRAVRYLFRKGPRR